MFSIYIIYIYIFFFTFYVICIYIAYCLLHIYMYILHIFCSVSVKIICYNFASSYTQKYFLFNCLASTADNLIRGLILINSPVKEKRERGGRESSPRIGNFTVVYHAYSVVAPTMDCRVNGIGIIVGTLWNEKWKITMFFTLSRPIRPSAEPFSVFARPLPCNISSFLFKSLSNRRECQRRILKTEILLILSVVLII